MKVLVQRVLSAKVEVHGRLVAAIDQGLLVFLGVGREDGAQDCDLLIDKLLHLRVFEDQTGRMNFSLVDKQLDILVVPQFTLMASCRKGRRPDFTQAAEPARGEAMFGRFITGLKARWNKVEQGIFKASMQVTLVNDGPVTLMIDSKDFLK